MKLNRWFKAAFFLLLIANDGYFILTGQYVYALATLLLLLLFVIIVEAFERGLSNIIFKTSQTQLDIKMAEKELQKQSKQLATKLAPGKKAAVEETREILEDNLQQAFHKGLKIAGYTHIPAKKISLDEGDKPKAVVQKNIK